VWQGQDYVVAMAVVLEMSVSHGQSSGHQTLLDRVTACVSHAENTTILWLWHITYALSWTLLSNCHFTLYCVLCCAV
jgi:hypothetical protein